MYIDICHIILGGGRVALWGRIRVFWEGGGLEETFGSTGNLRVVEGYGTQT